MITKGRTPPPSPDQCVLDEIVRITGADLAYRDGAQDRKVRCDPLAELCRAARETPAPRASRLAHDRLPGRIADLHLPDTPSAARSVGSGRRPEGQARRRS